MSSSVNLSETGSCSTNRNKSKKCLKVAHFNVENLNVHKESFFSQVENFNLDIIAISESFLKPVISSLPYNLAGYNFIRNDREVKEGGGVAVYINQLFNYKIISASQPVYSNKPEYLILEISHGWKLLLCVVYRPPKAGQLNELFDILANLVPQYLNIVIIGDFNIDLNSDRQVYDKTQLLQLVDNLNFIFYLFSLLIICRSLIRGLI